MEELSKARSTSSHEASLWARSPACTTAMTWRRRSSPRRRIRPPSKNRLLKSKNPPFPKSPSRRDNWRFSHQDLTKLKLRLQLMFQSSLALATKKSEFPHHMETETLLELLETPQKYLILLPTLELFQRASKYNHRLKLNRTSIQILSQTRQTTIQFKRSLRAQFGTTRLRP